MKIALYVGRFRFPLKPSDIGVEFFEAIHASKHDICALLVEPEDPLVAFGTQKGLNVVPLPLELNAPVADMRRYFSSSSFTENVERFLQRIHDAAPDIGVVYCGAWIPPVLRVAMPLGFVNLHPGPLPELSGYDPEKFMIIGDYPIGRGTVHRTADLFDTGNILQFTPDIPLPQYTTTPELAGLISRAGFQTMLDVLDCVAGSKALIGTPQEESRRGYATRKQGYVESVIRWSEDTHRKLNSRLRAFNSLDDGMPLKISEKGKYRIVYDLETHNGDFPGELGEPIGTYRGQGDFLNAPIFRTTEGAAVLKLGPPLDSHDTDFFLTEEQLIESGERSVQTTPDEFEF